jgi:penicillin-binding protein 2
LILADSRLKYSLIIKPQYVNERRWQEYKSRISKLFNISSVSLEKKYSEGLKNKKFSITLLDDLKVEQVIQFKENENNLNGLEISEKIIRNYPYKTVASHVIGYTQPITDSEFNILSKKGYRRTRET